MREQHKTSSSQAQPGSAKMPAWNVGELIEPPRFNWSKWFALLGPGLIMGGTAIGGGEWLMGPVVTAKYGGGLLWLATLSILAQVIYNVEISRYALYTGEPIFTGKFRTLPGPQFWIVVYLLLDFGSVFPYLAGYAATPLAAIILKHVPNPEIPAERQLLQFLSYGIFLTSMIPLIFGGKIYQVLKAIMTFKIFSVMSFLLVVAICYSHWGTWEEIFTGFFKFGNVPIRRAEDLNQNGILDPGEDWDQDGRLDVKEPSLKLLFDTNQDGVMDATDLNEDGQPDPMVTLSQAGNKIYWPDFDRDGEPDQTVKLDLNGDGEFDQIAQLDRNQDGQLDRFVDLDGDQIQDGDNLDNLFLAFFSGRPLPQIDWSLVAFLSALVAISGAGGLSNTTISNYTRDQGWGMGHHVGSIPSLVGGQDIQLSHVGTIFKVDQASLARWKGWYRHVLRDQLVVWFPACFFGLALPSMLSVEFLARGTSVDNEWVAASMTAGAIQERVGGQLGNVFWFLTLFCGFLVLAPSMASVADGVIRRWVDAFWTASSRLRNIDPTKIRFVYFAVLSIYILFGLTMLSVNKPESLLKIASAIYNIALGVSCWHCLVVNSSLLPPELRPHWIIRILLFFAGSFFLLIATASALQKFGYL